MIRKPFLENPSGLYKKLNYFGPKKLDSLSKDTLYAHIPDFSFLNQEGDSFTQANLDGKMYVAAFICTSCSTSCPKIAAQFFRMQKKVNYIKAFTVIAHSVYPETETPSALKNYARVVHADPGYWNFLTGNRKSLMDIAHFGYGLSLPDSTRLEHQTNIFLIDKNRHIRGIYDGTSTEQVNRLIDELKVLDAEYRVAKRVKI